MVPSKVGPWDERWGHRCRAPAYNIGKPELLRGTTIIARLAKRKPM